MKIEIGTMEIKYATTSYICSKKHTYPYGRVLLMHKAFLDVTNIIIRYK